MYYNFVIGLFQKPKIPADQEKVKMFFNKLQAFGKKKSVKYGVPFLILMIGGSFGLKEFAQLRYQFSKKQPVNSEDMKKYGIKMKKAGEVSLETEYEKIKKIDIDTWENKRGPRPWEENVSNKENKM